MVIHSVTPAMFLEEQPELPQFVWKKTGFGHVQGYDTPEGFQLSRIHTTNPRRYLDKAFSPGAVMRADDLMI